MNSERVWQPALDHAQRQAWPRWILPILVGAAWIALLYLVGTDVFHWASANVTNGALVVGAGAALFLLPGLAVLQIAWPERTLPWTERWMLAGGVSLALPPLLLQLVHVLGLRWNSAATWAYVGIALGTLLWSVRWRWEERERVAGPVAWHGFLITMLLLITLALRLFVVRDLPVGMWGDSYHHTMIAQLLVDHGGLFQSWEPYAPLNTFTYHYGFHANAAFFHWLTGMPVAQSVILVGQFANVLSVGGAYVLTVRLGDSRGAGVWAVALTAFVNMIPAYFVNWGRYTQLTGQAIVPALAVCWLVVLSTPMMRWRIAVLAVVLTASLMLTHYIVTIFAALLVLALLVGLVVTNPQWRTVGRLVWRSAAMGSAALVLAAPWLLNTLNGFLTRNVAGHIAQHDPAAAVAIAFPPVWPLYVALPLLVLAAAGVGAAWAQGRRWLPVLAAWACLVLAVTSPDLVGLSGRGVVNVPTAYMALYMIVVPLAAYAVHACVKLIAAQRAWLQASLTVAGLIGVSVWGVHWQQRILVPEHMLFTPADAAAMKWIARETPADARFLVDMFPAYNDTLFVGSDGGWWIPLLTHRHTTLPPITYGSERAADPQYYQQINQFAWALRKDPLPSVQGLRLLRSAGIDYVYSGAHVDATRTLDPQMLRTSESLRVVYERDGVVIFALQP
jgi:hypothetical protein